MLNYLRFVIGLDPVVKDHNQNFYRNSNMAVIMIDVLVVIEGLL